MHTYVSLATLFQYGLPLSAFPASLIQHSSPLLPVHPLSLGSLCVCRAVFLPETQSSACHSSLLLILSTLSVRLQHRLEPDWGLWAGLADGGCLSAYVTYSTEGARDHRAEVEIWNKLLPI